MSKDNLLKSQQSESTTTTTPPNLTPNFQIGWSISGVGIPDGAIIVDILEPTTTTTLAPLTPTIVITSQPQSVNLGYDICGGQPEVPYTFTVVADLLGSSESLSYQWQYTNNQSQWTNFTDETKATGIYTPSLTTKCGDTGLSYLNVKQPFRVIISAPGVDSVISSSVGFSYYVV